MMSSRTSRKGNSSSSTKRIFCPTGISSPDSVSAHSVTRPSWTISSGLCQERAAIAGSRTSRASSSIRCAAFDLGRGPVEVPQQFRRRDPHHGKLREGNPHVLAPGEHLQSGANTCVGIEQAFEGLTIQRPRNRSLLFHPLGKGGSFLKHLLSPFLGTEELFVVGGTEIGSRVRGFDHIQLLPCPVELTLETGEARTERSDVERHGDWSATPPAGWQWPRPAFPLCKDAPLPRRILSPEVLVTDRYFRPALGCRQDLRRPVRTSQDPMKEPDLAPAASCWLYVTTTFPKEKDAVSVGMPLPSEPDQCDIVYIDFFELEDEIVQGPAGSTSLVQRHLRGRKVLPGTAVLEQIGAGGVGVFLEV